MARWETEVRESPRGDCRAATLENTVLQKQERPWSNRQKANSDPGLLTVILALYHVHAGTHARAHTQKERQTDKQRSFSCLASIPTPIFLTDLTWLTNSFMSQFLYLCDGNITKLRCCQWGDVKQKAFSSWLLLSLSLALKPLQPCKRDFTQSKGNCRGFLLCAL